MKLSFNKCYSLEFFEESLDKEVEKYEEEE